MAHWINCAFILYRSTSAFVLLRQAGVADAIELAEKLDSWSGITIISFIAALSTYGLFRIAIRHHKELLKSKGVENSRLRKENVQLRRENNGLRKENRDLKQEIIKYLTMRRV